MMRFRTFTNFENCINAFAEELYELYKNFGSQVDEQENVKEVSPPSNETCTCECCNEHSCNCTYDNSVLNEVYTASPTSKDYEELECHCCENKEPCNNLTIVNNGWGINDNLDWSMDVYVPVDNEHTEVNILDGKRVQVSYEESTRRDEAHMSGYSHQSGSYVFPLPESVELSTFRAKKVGSHLQLTVSPLREFGQDSCIKVNID